MVRDYRQVTGVVRDQGQEIIRNWGYVTSGWHYKVICAPYKNFGSTLCIALNINHHKKVRKTYIKKEKGMNSKESVKPNPLISEGESNKYIPSLGLSEHLGRKTDYWGPRESHQREEPKRNI